MVYCLESLPKRRLPPDRAMFYVASTVLGLEDRGNLRAGSRADLVLLDKDTLEVKKTYLGGRLVWERDKI